MPDKTKTLAILGGGAAGVFAAIAAAQANPRQRVIVLEKSRVLLGKVKISGGGRCNVTTSVTDPAQAITYYPRGGAALRGPFTRFGPHETAAWFTAQGVALKTEADGRVFPTTDNSQTIIDCLLQAARAAGVALWTGVQVVRIVREEQGFALQLTDAPPLLADKLLIATGSNTQGYAWAKALGHSLVPPVPSLFTFNIKDPRLTGLAGVSVPNASVQLGKLTQSGPVLVTHWGLSGPAILKLSAWAARELAEAHYQATLRVNWLPHLSEDELRTRLNIAKENLARQVVAGHPQGGLPQRLWESLIGEAALQRWGQLSKTAIATLISLLQHADFRISGKGTFKEEFVTCGGVNLKEVNFKTMESKVCPNLYLAGEVLDIDGLTGGFNFQSAWTTGWLAGQAMAKG